ncbi:bacterial dynamin-like protein [Argopecten irradians]|uniref:bacterial dynamin-like protein n=1 Tax=Argopecten irradians TaxID=31199 RepID=UPI003714A145
MAEDRTAVNRKFQRDLKTLLKKDEGECKQLLYAFTYINERAVQNASIREHIEKYDTKVLKHVEQGITDLEKVDRPILVIGESSAGKSSFLNLLIGRKVLPELSRPCTLCMCYVKKGSELQAHVSSLNDCTPRKIIKGNRLTDQQFQTELREHVKYDESEDDPNRCLEVFVPCSILEDNVFLVDTPGFGDNERVTEKLLKFLTRAIGVIFVLNSSTSLGISEDRGVPVLQEILRLHDSGQIPAFDPGRIIFIANKWDTVTECERQDHRQEMINKIQIFWKDFHETQLFPLSVTEVWRKQNKGQINEDYVSAEADYENVLTRIHRTVESCATAKSRKHKMFLKEVIKHMKRFVDPIDQDLNENVRKLGRFTTLVAEMECKLDQGKEFIDDQASIVQRKLAKEIFEYLNKEESIDEIFKWKQFPEASDYNELQKEATSAIQKFIDEAISQHILNVTELVDELDLKIDDVNAELSRIRKQITCFLKDNDIETVTIKSSATNSDIMTEEDGGMDISGVTVAALAIAVPLLVPVGLVGLIPMIPVAAAMHLSPGSKMSSYKKNKKQQLDIWSKQYIQTACTESKLHSVVFSYLDDHIHTKFTGSCSDKLVREYKQKLDDLKEKYQTNTLPDGFLEVRDVCRHMEEILRQIELS